MTVDDKKKVGRRLKSGLVDAGISNSQFAEQIGVSRYTVDEWCTGRSGISLANASRICDELHWSLDKLACREDWDKKE